MIIEDSFKNLEKYIGKGYKIVQKDHGKWIVKEDEIVSCLDANYWKGIDNHRARTAVYDGYYAIRMLSPLECFRLMGFDDEDFSKAKESLNQIFYKGKDKSKSRLYKLAGNSIVVNVLEEIFKELLLK